MTDSRALINSALRTIRIEHDAIGALPERIDENFVQACQVMLACQGRIVVTGMGKSGHIARKIAATLSSTGSPAMFVHPAEASHGDLGMITGKDVVLALSYSGTTEELINILPLITRKGATFISMTGNKQSTLAQTADINLDASVTEEACPLGQAPTASTTVALVLGDALAMALLEAKGFTQEDFAFSHPGGRLGRRLLLKVKDIMKGGDLIPRTSTSTLLKDALFEISSKGLGMTTVVNERGQLCGVFTDGDLRRALDAGKDIRTTQLADVMSPNFKSVNQDAMAVEAARLMEDYRIYTLVVLDQQQQLAGIIRMHDLLQANVV
ncbi:KpsF/GutQ family sugar-phosphate isomerase [Pseudohongiella spirulinae]|uniref:Arabinose 5-phosphate isomerase n=1 Tax=Pseudohongiella spirulinae TaxID=1249552 RepID=A0A0S2KF46_9GAMM|nr:KpsF/GutQ family sugar-phosphate isomerase [Pseudohongiella spirulinae]ALO46966.1 Arabinose 5-phosphate isomerase [Pseudohongiella spirulinae]